MSSANLMTVPWQSEADRAKDAAPSPQAPAATAPSEKPEAPATGERAPASQPAATEVRGPAEIEGDADEIEKYFASLMQRVGGGGQPTPASNKSAAPRSLVHGSSPASPAVTNALPSRLSNPASPRRSSSVPSGPSPIVAPPAPMELPPRRVSTEKKGDLQILRDVANVHRLGAIDRYDCQSLFRRAYGVWVIGTTMGAASLGFSILPASSSLWFVASLATFAASIVCTAAYWRMTKRHRRQVEAMQIEQLLLIEGNDAVFAEAMPPAQEIERA